MRAPDPTAAALAAPPAAGPGHEDDTPWPADAVEVARVIDAWGIKGQIRVRPYADDPQALFSSRRWFVRPGSDLAPARPLPRLLRIRQAREHGDAVVATADELPDRNAAEAMKGARIYVSRASFPTPQDDEYYWIDLIGLQVRNREGVEFGTVADLIETGAQSVLRVVREQPAGNAGAPGPAERLIPFVSAYVDKVDLAGRCITVDWGEDY
jgi:16S rRNA processing protein RimM